ncbi:hypothetical protein [Tissierella sp. Yu-01]|uniref:hypothetical protein n=1 Tax=Tissierella sp. Yu-01 TaxID=3035694 RepID=UPI00240DD538|nr:hypothetical protein [Tissierella sp. Yu-01]WFA07695.1 hypothetical protein P3962_08030 [Tissierella sp. Yu-01]
MKRSLNARILAIGFLIILISITITSKKTINVSKIDNKVLRYYPTTEMTKIFKSNLQDEGFTHIVDRIEEGKVQIKQVDLLTRVVMVYDITEDYIKLIYTEEVAKDEFKDNYIQGVIPNRDDFILKVPIEVGTKWYDNIGGYFEIIKTNAMVETPTGTFETVVVRYKNDDFTVKEYYAENIGLVKIVLNNYGEYQLIQLIPRN